MTTEEFYEYTPQEVIAAVDARGERREVIARDLARYYNLLERIAKGFEDLFTENELHFLADMTSSTWFDALGIEALPFMVEDALSDYGRKWEIDPVTIVQKMQSLDYVSLYALTDGIERSRTKAGRAERTTPLDITLPPETASALERFTK